MALPDYVQREVEKQSRLKELPDYVQQAVKSKTPPSKKPPLLTSLLMQPGGRDIVLDSLGMGFGNEIIEGGKALYKSATDGQGPEQTFRGYYDKGMADVEARKDKFSKAQPTASMIGNVAPAMLTGTGTAKLLNPKTVKGAIGYGLGEGAVFGAGSEKPGLENRAKGAAVGGVLGGTASTVIPLAVKLATKGVPKATKGFHDMFSRSKPQAQKNAVADGDKFLANFYKRLGLTSEKAAELSKKKFRSSETLADVTSEQSRVLLPGLAASSDEAAEIARKSSIATRQDPDTLVRRIQSSSGANDAAMDGATKYYGQLKNTKKAIGSQIDDQVDATLGAKVGRQDEIADFFTLDAASGLEKEVNKSLQLRKRGPSFAEEGAKVDDFGMMDKVDDVNSQIYDEAFMQETSSRLGKRISKLKKEGIDYADEVELKKQFDEIFDNAIGDSSLKSLKNDYGVLSRQQRAFESGMSGKSTSGKPLTLRLLKDELSGMDAKDLEAFKIGALSQYAEKGDDLLKALGSPTERRRIGLIFGNDKAQMAKTISEREAGFATVSESLASGTTAQSRQVAKETLKGDLDGIDTLFKRLENKRAYSGIGAAGLFVNEVISIIHQTKLSNQAVSHILKKVSVSGSAVNKALAQIAKVDMPKLARDKLLKEEMSRLAKAVTSGYGATAGSLSERLTSGDYGR